jgi:hypothetical protein
MAKIKLEDVQLITELAEQGIGLAFTLLAARAKQRGREYITIDDIHTTRISLGHELKSGRSIEELLERLKKIANEG